MCQHRANGAVSLAEQCRRRVDTDLVHGVVKSRACEHGHQGAGYAMAGAVDNAQQVVFTLGTEDVEVTADNISRVPKDEMPLAQRLLQRLIRKNGALDQTGIVDRSIDFPVRLLHGLIGFFECLRSGDDFVFQFFGIALDFFGHQQKGTTQVAEFILAGRG